jgi:putative selenium metabolism hydrolase
MKASLAAMVYGLKTLAADTSALRGEVVLAAVVQEEPYEGVAIRSLIEDEGLWPSFVVLGEPTNLDIALGHRGRVELHVATEGRACHASAPELGENALYAAAKVIFGIEMLSGHLAEDPRLGKGSVAVTGIRCTAGSNNVVPDYCELIIDRRLTLGETRDRAVAEIRQIVEREGVRGTVRVAERETVTYTGYVNRGQEYYPPWLMAEDAPLIKMAAKAVERTIERRPRLKAWAFSTDGAYTRGEAGIPTVGFGPGEERYAHTVNEQVRLADVVLAAKGYAAIASEVLSKR